LQKGTTQTITLGELAQPEGKSRNMGLNLSHDPCLLILLIMSHMFSFALEHLLEGASLL
jgi:hypothetical protein